MPTSKTKQIYLATILATLIALPLNASAFHVDENAGASPNMPRTPVFGHKEKHNPKVLVPHEVKVGVNVMPQEINYAYGFEADKANFVPGEFKQTQGITKDWFVLVNVHTDMPLNVTNVFDRDKRTLKWGSPFENARVNFFKIGDPHQQSALVRDWTQGKHRRNVSFVFIPPNTQVEYIIGYASPQEGAEFRDQAGGGMQMRLKSLPAGTIVLDSKLVGEQQLGKSVSQKSFSLDKLLINAIKSYNRAHPAARLPQKLADPNTYPYDMNNIDEVNEHHLNL